MNFEISWIELTEDEMLEVYKSEDWSDNPDEWAYERALMSRQRKKIAAFLMWDIS
jgi:hypothetical protein